MTKKKRARLEKRKCIGSVLKEDRVSRPSRSQRHALTTHSTGEIIKRSSSCQGVLLPMLARGVVYYEQYSTCPWGGYKPHPRTRHPPGGGAGAVARRRGTRGQRLCPGAACLAELLQEAQRGGVGRPGRPV